ncbi:TlpA family protein disulfide reductase [Niabella hirudinis]|uniref:TlpA family protein disulfide reductase n=1 Tax=Niabella hirudinis TaxID=1285929 RepID=UPI003EBE4010
MKFYSVLLSLLIFNLCFSQADLPEEMESTVENQETTIVAILKPGGNIGFNYLNLFTRYVALKNYSNTDTTIIKKILIKKPSHLSHQNIIMQIGGPPILRTHNLLLLPGDSVVLKQKEDGTFMVQYSSGFSNFIDRIVEIPGSFISFDKKQLQKSLESIGIEKTIQNIEATFRKNENVIKNLNLSAKYANGLRAFNKNIKYTELSHLLSANTPISPKVADSLYDIILKHNKDLGLSDAPSNLSIAKEVVFYNVRKKTKTAPKDFWADIFKVDTQMRQSAYYKQYLISCVAGTFANDYKTMNEVNGKLRAVRAQNIFFDTLYQLTSILLGTSTDFKKAKENLKAFNNGNFSFLLENSEKSANHEMKNINVLPAVNLYDFSGKKFDFKNMVMDKKYKLTIVDFWASWCIPCIGQFPYLKKIEKQLKNKPINFVTISIDNEADTDKWITVSKKSNIFSTPHQYRLENFKTSPLTKLLGLGQLPRFVVIDAKGKVVNDDFYRPSDPIFELELLKYLN